LPCGIQSQDVHLFSTFDALDQPVVSEMDMDVPATARTVDDVYLNHSESLHNVPVRAIGDHPDKLVLGGQNPGGGPVNRLR
jgi:hypothetical protein